jgi:hypothetical protein
MLMEHPRTYFIVEVGPYDWRCAFSHRANSIGKTRSSSNAAGGVWSNYDEIKSWK